MLKLPNTLQQVVQGYLCGANVNRWKNHLFRNKTRPTSPNVQCYFYRFEFQDRGTLHFHLHVWLKHRAYIMSLLPALKCRMDVQTTDGRSMLLRYVTNYVTTWQDAYSDNALYSMHLTSSTCLFSTPTTFLNTSCSTTYTGVWLS